MRDGKNINVLKYWKVILLFTLFCFFSSCIFESFPPVDERMRLINNGSEPVQYYCTCGTNLDTIGHNLSGSIGSGNLIWPSDTGIIPAWAIWDTLFKECAQQGIYLHIYETIIIDSSDYESIANSNTYEKIRRNNKYNKRILLDIDELKKSNWLISYK